jgi:hypothetical protein
MSRIVIVILYILYYISSQTCRSCIPVYRIYEATDSPAVGTSLSVKNETCVYFCHVEPCVYITTNIYSFLLLCNK